MAYVYIELKISLQNYGNPKKMQQLHDVVWDLAKGINLEQN